MTADLPDRATDREREVRLSPDGKLVAIRRDSNDWRVSNGGHYRDIHVADWLPLALAARPAPDDGEAHCPTCICGRRAPVQGERVNARGALRDMPSGTVAWVEHEQAYVPYAARFGTGQSAERLAERGGFGYWEMTDLLGHEPTTWSPR